MFSFIILILDSYGFNYYDVNSFWDSIVTWYSAYFILDVELSHVEINKEYLVLF